MTSQTKYFEDFRIGEKFTIPSKTITDAHFLFFSGLTGDNNPIHYDVEYARATRFGKPITHGLLVASMTAAGASTLNQYLEGSIIAFLEQSSRFLIPVLLGDTIYPELEISDLVPKTDVGVVRVTSRVKNQHSELCLEGMHAYLIKKRPT